MRLSGTVLAMSVALGAAMPATGAQAANIFDAIGDALFGGRRPEPQVVQEPGDGLNLTVRPRHRSFARPARTREPQKIVNTSIDPVQHPDWYLQDPTMRRGDVVVLKGEVLVFNGGRAPYTRADFTSLAESRSVAKAVKTRIRAMAGLPPDGIVEPAVRQAARGKSARAD